MTDTESSPLREASVDFDVMAPTTLADNDAAWRSLRSMGSITWTPHNGGHWVISSYDEVGDAFRDWELFSSARTDPERSSVSIRATIPLLVPEELDPPEWKPPRRVLAVQLSPNASERLRPRARFWANHYLDQFIESGRGDLVNDFASPVPASVTLEWLGFPESDWELMEAAFHGPEAANAAIRGDDPFTRVAQRIAEEVDARIARPRDDGMSAIVTCEVDGERLPPDVARALVFLTIGGGVDTTSSLTGAALVHLHHHPDDRARLLAEPELLAESATEEFLRFYPPARTHARTVTRDATFAGCPMHAGDRVLLSEASAGRDPNVFPDPDRFVIDRFPNRHLSFGAGIHRCPGSHLARIMFQEMMRAVLERIPDYQIVDDDVVEYKNWSVIGGWVALPAVFTPGPRLG